MARIAGISREDIDERNLRVRLLDEVRRVVPFDASVWLLTDPETTVGSSPVADLGLGGATGAIRSTTTTAEPLRIRGRTQPARRVGRA